MFRVVSIVALVILVLTAVLPIPSIAVSPSAELQSVFSIDNGQMQVSGESTSFPGVSQSAQINLPAPKQTNFETWWDNQPIRSHLSISSAPKLGETAELSFMSNVDASLLRDYDQDKLDNLANAQARVEFYWTDIHGSYSEAKHSVQVPASEILGDRYLNWAGNALQSKDIALKNTIQFPREGIWDIRGFFSGMSGSTQYPVDHVKIAVTRDAAAIMGTPEFKSCPLAYLGGFPYGAAAGGEAVPNELRPVIMELNISKAPLVGEEAVVTCRIDSLHDVTDFSAQVIFWLKNEKSFLKIPVEQVLVDGDLGWTGDLKQGQPVEFSATVKLPEYGYWDIYAYGNSLENESNHMDGHADNIYMTVGNELSYFSSETRPSAMGNGADAIRNTTRKLPSQP
jgi:hypothetical protein